jgi:hypothetical protein
MSFFISIKLNQQFVDFSIYKITNNFRYFEAIYSVHFKKEKSK